VSKSKIPLHVRRRVRFEELGALLGVRAMLAGGIFPHGSTRDERHREFNMNIACSSVVCGTTSCIGGTMAIIMGLKPDEATTYVGTLAGYGNHSQALTNLFFPSIRDGDGWDKGWSDITPDHAVRAIDNWLRDGRPRWRKVVAK
jgi:hypothetical protein